MNNTIKDNVLHLEIPLHAPRPSATGKTLTVASSNGRRLTDDEPDLDGFNRPRTTPNPDPDGFD